MRWHTVCEMEQYRIVHNICDIVKQCNFVTSNSSWCLCALRSHVWACRLVRVSSILGAALSVKYVCMKCTAFFGMWITRRLDHLARFCPCPSYCTRKTRLLLADGEYSCGGETCFSCDHTARNGRRTKVRKKKKLEWLGLAAARIKFLYGQH